MAVDEKLRNALRHVPVVGRAAAREHWEEILREEPPDASTAPWAPEPPEWMLDPEPVFDMRNQPVQWVDRAPYMAWAERIGKAKYQLMLLDGLAPEDDEGKADQIPAWMRPRMSRKTSLAILNHPAERLTVKERQDSGATGPWTTRSWINDRRERGLPVPPPPPAAAKEDEIPEAECSIAPWWDE
ncbi:hypothetical protein ACIA8H_12920 [Streptomyces goshikiensis]|uniref:hypothetical protein n=1 Tax=Streptomyces goshikiensis TaxID=1942 RepID=UPI0037A6B670